MSKMGQTSSGRLTRQALISLVGRPALEFEEKDFRCG